MNRIETLEELRNQAAKEMEMIIEKIKDYSFLQIEGIINMIHDLYNVRCQIELLESIKD